MSKTIEQIQQEKGKIVGWLLIKKPSRYLIKKHGAEAASKMQLARALANPEKYMLKSKAAH